MTETERIWVDPRDTIRWIIRKLEPEGFGMRLVFRSERGVRYVSSVPLERTIQCALI